MVIPNAPTVSAIAVDNPRRPATIKVSARVPADICRAEAFSRTSRQAPAIGSFKAIATKADVSITITWAGRTRHKGNPGCALRTPQEEPSHPPAEAGRGFRDARPYPAGS